MNNDYQNIEYILFENATDLPVNIASFKRGHFSEQNEMVNPREIKLLHSKLGVWSVNTFVENKDLWIEKGLNQVLSMGQFYSKKNIIYGTYSYLIHPKLYNFEYNDLTEPTKEGAVGLIKFTFIYSN